MIAKRLLFGGRYNLDKKDISGIGFSIDVRYLLKNQFLNPTKRKLVNNSGMWFLEDNHE